MTPTAGKHFRFSAIALCLSAALPLMAQQSPDGAADEAAIEKITVRGEKTSRSLQDTLLMRSNLIKENSLLLAFYILLVHQLKSVIGMNRQDLKELSSFIILSHRIPYIKSSIAWQ